MTRIVSGICAGAALGFVIALAVNLVVFAGPEYGDALLWAVIGAIIGGLWIWHDARRK